MPTTWTDVLDSSTTATLAQQVADSVSEAEGYATAAAASATAAATSATNAAASAVSSAASASTSAAQIASAVAIVGDAAAQAALAADSASDAADSASAAASSATQAAANAASVDTATLLDRTNHTGTQVISTVSGLQGALDAKAPLASPSLTGTPTAPTATAGTNTVQVATCAFVKTAVDNLVASAPGALDTLDELAAALGDDANYAATITTALAAKAPLASPALTGTPTAPTATAGTNTTQIATTAFVAAGLALKANLASPTFTGTAAFADATLSGTLGVGVTPTTTFQAGTSTNRGGIEGRSDGVNLGGIASANLARMGGWYSTNPIPGAAVHFAAQGGAGQRGALAFLTKATDDDTTQPTVRAVITQGGNIGVGTTNPVFDATGTGLHLHGSGASDIAALHMTNGTTGSGATDGMLVGRWSSDNIVWVYENEPLNIGTNDISRIYVKGSGEVGIGTGSSPAVKLHVAGVTGETARFGDHTQTDQFVRVSATHSSADADVVLGMTTGTGFVGSRTNHPFTLRHNNVSRAELTATAFTVNGYLNVDNGSGHSVHVTDDYVRFKLTEGRYDAESTGVHYFHASGVWKASINADGTYSVVSDQRLKENVADLGPALATLQQLRPVTYTLKDDGRPMTGLIAQEVQPHLPELVTRNEAEDVLALNYGGLVPFLLKAVQELAARVEALETP